jgi:rod shape-determining protein MreD
LLQDLTTNQPLGIYSLSYGLVAIFTVSTQQLVYRGHPLTHFSLALFAAMVTGIIICVQGWLRGPAESAVRMFYIALYTAALAPLFIGGLNRIRRAFSFQPPRRKMRF